MVRRDYYSFIVTNHVSIVYAEYHRLINKIQTPTTNTDTTKMLYRGVFTSGTYKAAAALANASIV